MKKEISKKFNYGLCLLRLLMAFEVVLCHFWRDDSYSKWLNPFMYIRELAPPVFFLLSFMLVEKVFLSKDFSKAKKRFGRLVWPQIGWTVIYFGAYKLLEVILQVDITGGIRDMVWQLFTGHSETLNPTMWYQVSLIVLNVVFFVLFYFLPQKFGKISIVWLALGALVLQYTGKNFVLFSNMRFELKYPLGRTVEMIPYAVIGFYLAYFGIYKKLENYRIVTILTSLVMMVFFLKYPVFHGAQGFNYAGILYIVLSLCLVTVFTLLPLDNLPDVLKRIILVITKYTMGVYCMHRLVANVLILIFEKMQITMATNTFTFCILVYVVCYGISALLALIPLKLSKQLVE